MTAGILSAGSLMRAHGNRQIIDARTRHEYEAGHIPGAVWMGWEEWCNPAPAPQGSILHEAGYWGVLREAPEVWFSERLSACGVNLQAPLVVYSGGPRSRGREGRIAWMLLYLGAQDVALLDGGWPAWLEEAGRVDVAPAAPAVEGSVVTFQPHRRRSVSQISAGWRAGTTPLFVDTRSPEEFAGHMQEYLPRRGRFPGAGLVSFLSLFDCSGCYVDRDTYLRLLPMGMVGSDKVVAYCEVGVRAAVFSLLHEIYTGAIMPLCDGSLVEWAVQSRLPLQSGIPYQPSQLTAP